MKYIYLVNRFQLKKKTALMIERLNRISRKMKRDFEILVNKSPEQAGSAVRRYRNPGNIITAVGGDGAINHVLNDLAGTDTILSFFPSVWGMIFSEPARRRFPTVFKMWI